MNQSQIDDFVHQGFVRIQQAIPRQIVEECTEILWRDAQCDPLDPETWNRPVVRLGDYSEAPFRAAANTPVLHEAFDALVGPGRWQPRESLGTFPIRFPSAEEPDDTGWHVDASFPGDNPDDFFQWRVNVYSRGRALLMLFLFSDVSPLDAPTRIRCGSHQEVARILEPAGERGLSFVELASALNATERLPEIAATGNAGDVYLCHPFLAHAAQAHRGDTPRVIAQPPLPLAEPLRLERTKGAYTPVEAAVRAALHQ